MTELTHEQTVTIIAMLDTLAGDGLVGYVTERARDSLDAGELLDDVMQEVKDNGELEAYCALVSNWPLEDALAELKLKLLSKLTWEEKLNQASERNKEEIEAAEKEADAFTLEDDRILIGMVNESKASHKEIADKLSKSFFSVVVRTKTLQDTKADTLEELHGLPAATA